MALIKKRFTDVGIGKVFYFDQGKGIDSAMQKTGVNSYINFIGTSDVRHITRFRRISVYVIDAK